MDPVGPIELTRRELLAQRPVGEAEDIHFPESLAALVIEAYSRPGDVVLDPFAGYGTTAVVAARLGRRPIAIELLPRRAARIRRRLRGVGTVITGDARQLSTLVQGPVDLCLTSPPYMTATGHPENPLTGYRTLDGDYGTYLGELEAIATIDRGPAPTGWPPRAQRGDHRRGRPRDPPRRRGRRARRTPSDAGGRSSGPLGCASRGPHRRPLPRVPEERLAPGPRGADVPGQYRTGTCLAGRPGALSCPFLPSQVRSVQTGPPRAGSRQIRTSRVRNL